MNSLAEALALTLTGVLAVPTLQLLKRLFGLSGTAMVWFSFLFSLLIGAIVAAWTGQASLPQLLSDPLSLLGPGSIVMAVATVVYRTLKEKLNLGGKL